MSIRLSNLTVSGNAAAGTVVGDLALVDASAAPMTANFLLGDGSAGFFGVSGVHIVTIKASLPPGNYSVFVEGVGTRAYWREEGYFAITVTPT